MCSKTAFAKIKSTLSRIVSRLAKALINSILPILLLFGSDGSTPISFV